MNAALPQKRDKANLKEKRKRKGLGDASPLLVHDTQLTDKNKNKKMYDNRDNIDFGKNRIGKLFASIFFPTLLGMMFNMAFLLTDGIFVGHGIGEHGLATINLIGPIMMLINGLGMMLGMGASVVAAIHLSHGNVKAARINVTQAFMAGIAVSVAMGAFCYLFPDTVLKMLGVKGDLYAPTREYYLWFLPTCLLLMIETLGLFVIRLDGSPRYAMLSNIIPAVVNGVMDYIFIFPCHWGVMGAALATDIGGLVGALMVGYYMLFRTRTLHLYPLKRTWTSLRLTLRNVGYMVKVGAPGLVGEAAVSVMMLSGNLAFMKHIGDDGVAAYSIACYLFPLVYMICNAVAQSAQPIISYNYGAGERRRVSHTLRFSLGVSVVVGALVSMLFLFFSPQMVLCFLNRDVAAYGIAAEGLPYYGAGFLFMAINICMVGYLQSIEKSGAAIIFTLLRGMVLLVAAFVLLPRTAGVRGLWLAVPCAELATTAAIALYGLWLRPREKSCGKEQ